MNRVDMTRWGARTMRPKMDQKRATTLRKKQNLKQLNAALMTVTPISTD